MSTVTEHITEARVEAIRVQVLDYIEAHQDAPITRLAADLCDTFSLSPEKAGQYMAEWVKQ